MHYFTVWDGSQQVQITLAYMVMKSVIAMEAIRMTLWPFRGFQSYDEAIWGHFYCKIALFHPPFWPLGNAGKDLKIVLGEFLEPKPHAKFFFRAVNRSHRYFFSPQSWWFWPFFGGSVKYLKVDRRVSNLKSCIIRVATTPVKSIFVGPITWEATPANFPKLVRFGCFSPM